MHPENKIAQAVSYIVHPLLMPLLGLLFILTSGTYLSLMPMEAKKAIMLIVALSTLLLPVSVLPFLYYQKLITHYTIPKRSERLTPLFLTTAFYLFCYIVLRRLGAPQAIQHFIMACTVALFMASIIHIKWKISLHMIGLGGIIGLISYFGYLYTLNTSGALIIAIFLAGIVGSARLILEAHTQNQIYSGFLLGFSITFLVLFVMGFYV